MIIVANGFALILILLNLDFMCVFVVIFLLACLILFPTIEWKIFTQKTWISIHSGNKKRFPLRMR